MSDLPRADVRNYYTDCDGHDARMLCYTSAPFAAHHELSGHVVVTLYVAAGERDAALHVYLEDVGPDGRCRYVTEGMLRALHRKESTAPSIALPLRPCDPPIGERDDR